MAQLRVMSSRGDKMLTWDPRQVETGDPEAVAAVREVERIIQEHTARGATVFQTKPGEPAERVETFNPLVEQTLVVVPRITGG